MMKPYLTQVDNGGYPFKVGDTVIGQSSGRHYEIIKNPSPMGTGYKCRRKTDGHLASLGVARDGRLHKKHRAERNHLINEIMDGNDKLMREMREAKLEAIKARARKVPVHAKYEHHA
jgi:hypothetical protein